MKIDAPLISISTTVPESGELAERDPTVTPGGDFSALLLLLAAPQNPLPAAVLAAQFSGEKSVEAVASGGLAFTAPLPAAQPAPAGADLGETDQAVQSMPETIGLPAGSATQRMAGAPAEIAEETSGASQSPLLSGAAYDGSIADYGDLFAGLSPMHAAGQRSADRQMIAPENGETSTPAEAIPTAVPAGSLPPSDELTARLPVLTGIGEEELDPAIPAAAFMPNGERPPIQSVREIGSPTQPVRTAESTSENLPTSPDHQRLPKDTPTGAPASTSAKRSAPLIPPIESAVPIVASSGTQTAKPDFSETHATDSGGGTTVPQSAAIDLSRPVVKVQQQVASDQELANSAFEVNRKPGESSPTEHQEIFSAAPDFAAARTLNPELSGVDNPKSLASTAPVAHQVAREIATSIQSKRHEAIMTLDPPELGNLRIGLSIDGDQVQVHILAETRESRELLEKHLPELKQALQNQQLNVVNVRVESGRLSDFSGDPRQGFQQPPQERQQGQGHGARPSGAETTLTDARRIIPTRGEAGRVSMWA